MILEVNHKLNLHNYASAKTCITVLEFSPRFILGRDSCTEATIILQGYPITYKETLLQTSIVIQLISHEVYQTFS